MVISFSGLASGLDTSSWVKSLTALKQAKVTVLQEERENVLLSQETLLSIRNFFSSFRATIEKITDAKLNIPTLNLFAQNLATSADLNILTATATHEAEEGKYEIKVDKLASNTSAISGIKYNTTIVEQSIAKLDSKLSSLGVSAGNILVTVPADGLERGLEITADETIGSFIDKLAAMGVSAHYNETSGVFSIDIGDDDIDDIGHTNIVSALHLQGVNEGYVSNHLEVKTTQNVFNNAVDGTKLSELGVSNGTITIEHNDTSYNFTITNATKMGDFIAALRAKGIEASLEDGIFSITDADITSDGTTNLKTAFGLSEEVAEKSQTSNNLFYETTVVTVTAADEGTLLSSLGNGIAVSAGDTVEVLNSNNETKIITLAANSTVGSLLQKLTDAGLSATMHSDGTVEIAGGVITGGSFDAIEAFGLNEDPYTAYVTGNALTETVTIPEIVTLATEFVDDLNVTEGLLSVVDAEGTTHYMEIYDGLSIGEFITDLGNLGLLGELNTDTGVLTISGGDFSSLTQSQINNLDAAGKLNDVSLRTATDLLDLLFPDMASQTDTLQTSAVSYALRRNVTNTILAEADSTTLGNLGLTGNENATFLVRGTSVSVGVTTGMTINQFIDALSDKGISASFNEDTHRLTIENARLVSTGSLKDALDLTTSTVSKYTATTVASYATQTVPINATGETLFSELGITGNQTIVYYDESGAIGTLNATGSTTLQQFLDKATSVGLTATLEDGVIKIKDGYIDNDVVEEALGLKTTMTGYSHVLGTALTDTQTVVADRTTKLSDIGITSAVSATIKNVDGDTVTVLSFTTDKSLGDIFDALENNGITASISDGIISLSSASGNYITADSTLATELGIGTDTNNVTSSTSYISGNLNANATLTTNRETTLGDLNITSYNLTINETDGDTITTAFSSTTSVGTILDWLSSNGVSASISDGIISLSSTTGAYVTGNLADAFGISTTVLNETTTVGVLQTSSASKTYTANVVANLGTKLSETMSNYSSLNKTITVYNSEGQVVTTVAAATDETFGSLFAKLDNYGVQGSITDGVVTFTSSVGNYVSGDIIGTSGLGVGTATTTITQTIGNAQTSTALVTFTQSFTAGLETKLSETHGAYNNTGYNRTITILNSEGQTVHSFTTTADETYESLFAKLEVYGVQGSITDGVVTLVSTAGNYVSGKIIDDMGISTGTTNVITTIGQTVTATVASTYTADFTAGLSTELKEVINNYTDLNKTITVYNSEGQVVGTYSVKDTETFGSLFAKLDNYGVQGSITDGVVTFTSSVGNYVQGNIITNGLGVGTATTTITQTIGQTVASSGTVTYSATYTAGLSTELKEVINNYSSKDKNITIYNSSSQAIGTVTAGNTETFEDLFERLDDYGIQGSMTDGAVTLVSTVGNYVAGQIIDGMGIETKTTTVTTTIGIMVTSSTAKTYDTLVVAGLETELKNVINNYSTMNKTITVYNSEGQAVGTYSVKDTETFGSLFAELDNYGVQGSITDGVVTFTSSVGNYVSGAIIGTNGLGVGTATTTITQTIGKAQTSTDSVTYTQSLTAGLETELKEVITNYSTATYDKTITIYNSEGQAVRTITADDTETFGSLFAELDDYGVQGSITDGVVTLVSTTGNYVSGQIITDMGITTSSTTVVTTIGTAVTSTAVSTYTQRITANTDTLIKDLVDDTTISATTWAQLVAYSSAEGAPNGNVIQIQDSKQSGNVIGYITVSDDMTVGDLLTAFAGYGISATIDNGVISFDSADHIFATDVYADCGVLNELGIELDSGTEVTETAGVIASGNQITFTTSTTAVTDAKLVELCKTTTKADGTTDIVSLSILSSDTLTIYDVGGTAKYTYTAGDTTVGDLFAKLSEYGIAAHIDSNGKITIDGSNGYVSGAIATKLGITMTPSDSTSTIGLTVTSTAQITYTNTEAASYNSLLKNLGKGIVGGDKVVFRNKLGEEIGSYTVTNLATATVKDFMDAMANAGISSTIEDGVITINNTNGYIDVTTGDLADKLGIGETENVVTTTVGTTATTTQAVTYAYTTVATGDSTFAELGLVTGADTQTVTVTMVDTAGFATVISTVTASGVRMRSVGSTSVSSGNSILISDTQDIIALVNYVNAGYNTSGVKFILTNDIDLNGTTIAGIGTEANAFKGVFEGNGHVIKNFDIDNGGYTYSGFFNYTENAIIRNLGVDGTVRSSSTSPSAAAGILVGNYKCTTTINSATAANAGIFNCFTSGLVDTANLNFAGGVVGYMELPTTVDAMYDMFYVQSDAIVRGKNVGGIIGSVRGCSKLGNVTSKNRGLLATVSSGGFIGLLNQNIGTELTNCVVYDNYDSNDEPANSIYGTYGVLPSLTLTSVFVAGSLDCSAALQGAAVPNATQAVRVIQIASAKGYVTVTSDTTIDEFISGLDSFGVTAKLEDGVINVVNAKAYTDQTQISTDGNEVDNLQLSGALLTSLGMSSADRPVEDWNEIISSTLQVTYTVTENVTVGNSLTSTEAIIVSQSLASTAPIMVTVGVSQTGTQVVVSTTALTTATALGSIWNLDGENVTVVSGTTTFTYSSTDTLNDVFSDLATAGTNGVYCNLSGNKIKFSRTQTQAVGVSFYSGGETLLSQYVSRGDSYYTLNNATSSGATIAKSVTSSAAITYTQSTYGNTSSKLSQLFSGIDDTTSIEIRCTDGSYSYTYKTTGTAVLNSVFYYVANDTHSTVTMSYTSSNGRIITSDFDGSITIYNTNASAVIAQSQSDGSGGIYIQTPAINNIVTANSATTIGSISSMPSQTINYQKSDGTTSSIVVTSTSTFGDLINALNGAGFSASMSGGKITITDDAADSTDPYITSIGSYLAGILKVPTTASSYKTVQTQATVKKIMNGKTRMTDLLIAVGATNVPIFSVVQNGTEKTVSISGNDSVNDLIDKLGSVGITATVSNGALTITGSDNAYISWVGNTSGRNLANLGISTTASDYYTTQAVGQTDIFREFGLTSDATITLYNSATEEVDIITISPEDRVSLFKELIEDRAMDIDLTEGIVTITPQGDWQIVGVSNNLRDALKLNVTQAKYETFTNETTFADLGYTGGAVHLWSIANIGAESNIPSPKSFTPNDSVYDFFVSIGCDVTITDGKLNIEPPEGYYFADGSFAEILAQKLNIDMTTAGYSQNSSSVIHTFNMETSFDQLGLTSASGYKVTVKNSETGTSTVYTGGTVDESVFEFFNKMEGVNVSISDGKLQLTCDDGYCIMGMDSTLAAKLNIAHDFSAIDSNKLIATKNGTGLNNNLTMEQLGITVDGSWTIWDATTNSETAVVTYTKDTTLGDFLQNLTAAGVSSYINSDGNIVFEQDDRYIKNEDDELWQKLFGAAANSSTYETVATVYTNTNDPSDSLVDSGTKSIHLESTLSSIDGANGIVDNGTYTIVTDGGNVEILGSYSVAEMFDELAEKGIIGSITNDGKVVLTPTDGHYIKSIDNTLKSALKLSSDYYTSTSSTTISDGTSDELVWEYTTIADRGTYLSQIGITQDGCIKIYVESDDGIAGNGHQDTVSFTPGTTLGELLDDLDDYGIYSSIDNGVLTLIPTNDNYIIDDSDINHLSQLFENATGINFDTVNATTTYTAYGMKNSSVLETNTSVTINSNSTFEQLGLAANDKIVKVYYNGAVSTIEVDKATTVGAFMEELSEYGITSDIIDGKFVINGSHHAYITSMDNSVASALDITGEEASYKTTLSEGTKFNTNSNTLKDTQTVTLKADTTFKQLGLADDDTTMTVSVTSGEQTIGIRLTNKNTVGDFMDALAGAGISSEIVDGQLYIKASDYAYISSMNSTLADYLKISRSNNDYKQTDTDTVISNTNSNTMQETKSFAMTSDITFGQLGLAADNKTVKVYYNGAERSIDVDKATTVGEFMTKLSEYGITSDIIDGKFVINGSHHAYITSMDTNVAGALNISTSAVYKTTLSEGCKFNTNSNTLKDTQTVTLSSDTTFSELNVAADTTMTVSVTSGERVIDIVMTDKSSVGDFMSALAGAGISSEIVDGQLYIKASDYAYISSMNSTLAGCLQISTDINKYKQTDSDTVISNTNSNTMLDTKTVTMTSATTFGQLGLSTGNKVVKVNSDGNIISITVNQNTTVGDFMAGLAGAGISSEILNGKFSVKSSYNAFISVMQDDVASALDITDTEASYSTTRSEGTKFNTNSNTMLDEQTVTLRADTTFKQLGLANDNTTMTVSVTSGEQTIDIRLTNKNTVGDFMDALAGAGISSEIVDGKLYIKASDYAYISSMNSALAGYLKISSSNNDYKQTDTDTVISNTNSNTMLDEQTFAMSSESTFAQLGVGSGNKIVTVFSNSTNGDVLITMTASNTVGDFMAALAGYGIASEIRNGQIYIKPSNDAFIKDMNTDLANAMLLKTNDSLYSTTLQTGTTVNTNSSLHESRVESLPITNDTLMTGINGITVGTTATITKPDGTTATITVATNDTLSDIFTKLAQHGITGSVDSDGKISLLCQGDTTITGDLVTKLTLTTKTVNEDTVTTNTSSDKQEHIITVDMNDTTTMQELGITAGTVNLYKDGTLHTISITNNMSIAEFRNILADYGITSEIVDGQLSLTSDGIVRMEDVGSCNAVEKLGLEYDNWTSRGEFSQESDQLTDTQTIVPVATMQTKLKDITNSTGTLKNVSSGLIHIYQDGTRHNYTIDNNDTLESLANDLATYGITLGIDQDGKIYLYGEGDTYMQTASGGSNFLTALGFANVTETFDSTSRNLKYEEDTTSVINGETKMVDILSDGGAVTTGTYNVVANGVTTTETITNDTTVDDFIATLSTYGMTASINSDGQIAVGGQNNTFLKTSSYATGNSTVVHALFEEWEFINVYESNNLEIPTPIIETVTRDTKLSNINEGANYQAGFITVVKDGVQTDIELTADDTIGTLMDELALYGFECTLNGSGQLIVKNTGNSELKEYDGAGAKSNALQILGISTGWIKTNLYTGEAIDVITEQTYNTCATRDTLLSDLGVTTTGEYYVYSDGVRYTALISSDETLGSFLDTLETFGIQSNLVTNGANTVVQLYGSGDTYIASSNSATNKSDAIDVLFPVANNDPTYNYQAELKLASILTTMTDATEDTLLSDLDVAWTNNVQKAQGQLSLTVDGAQVNLEVTTDETVGTLMNKFNALGLDATINNGVITVASGFTDFTINTAGTTSKIVNDLNLAYQDDMGGYAASNDSIISTTTREELVEKSVANFADMNTKMGLLNISSGTFTVFRNGEKATVTVNKDQNFSALRSLVAGAFDEGDVDVKFEDGYLKFYSDDPDVSVEIGATTDTSNIAAICGLSNYKTGSVQSARQLYKVNGESALTTAGLFRLGTVTTGKFIIGDEEFEITDSTTLSSIIAQINSSEGANATASWDSIDGKLIIKSKSTGSSFINIEAVDSNFTDIMGYTTTTVEPGGDRVTRIKIDSQEVGDNASFYINGTHFTSTSNTITSDLSRIKGVTINLKGVSAEGGSTTLTVERDKETVANAVSDIVDAYNELIENVDKEVARGAQLADQSTLRMIRNNIRSLMTSSLAGATVFKNLDSIGISSDAASASNISTDHVNVLTFNKDKFLDAFTADREAVQTLLVGTNTDPGVFSKIETVLETSLAGVSGYFDSANRSYNTKLSKLDQKIAKANKEVERYKARLEAKFASMDLLIANIQNQYSSFLS